ncbi:CPBP family intramembrane glutamic endopeptidase [Butyrivibrio sp. AE2005]|uniref:CPBP family intramembrane glutamic endopeptidase n=1 Tax=Butyrivibrio sp. AE2005 TaxID=1496722 RepID=UPI00068EF1D0|nr:CPBP family intramembrane glutamic endopeptidase [Butyrivibrio sp. AE2005]
MEKFKALFYKIHNDYYRWYDFLLILPVIFFVLLLAGEIAGQLLFNLLIIPNMGLDDLAFNTAVTRYGQTIGSWIVLIVFLLIIKPDRPVLKTFWKKYKGNTVLFFLLGLLVGGGMNVFCAIVAMLNKDIAVYFNRFQFFKVFVVFVMVFFQSGSEEILCRGFLYQRLRRSFRSPWVAIIGNALVFGSLHLLNPDVSFLGFLNIVLFGVFMALMIYYYESMWMAIAVHTGWNYMQSIVLGLPNSGLVFDFSIFKLDVASATNSFAYNVGFGIEGTVLSSVVLAVGIVVIVLLGKKRKGDNLWVVGETVFSKVKEQIAE